jgi:ribosome-associated protein
VRPVEGLGDLAWVLLDYGDFIVHVFSRAAREFYDLERLWRDAKAIEVEERAPEPVAT